MMYLIPTDPPDGSPSCSVEPALNHTSLRLRCSWPGGFPSPSLYWTGDIKRVGQDQADTGEQTNPLSNTDILLPPEGLTSNNSLDTNETQDSGEYRCSTYNAVGGTEINITLVVKSKCFCFFYLFSILGNMFTHFTDEKRGRRRLDRIHPGAQMDVRATGKERKQQ
uniref:Ig-like domain-containing protein n=1 Tax=Mastacembelus armatus TaxID=205130 RepID=A0A7N9AMG5_9TELE